MVISLKCKISIAQITHLIDLFIASTHLWWVFDKLTTMWQKKQCFLHKDQHQTYRTKSITALTSLTSPELHQGWTWLGDLWIKPSVILADRWHRIFKLADHSGRVQDDLRYFSSAAQPHWNSIIHSPRADIYESALANFIQANKEGIQQIGTSTQREYLPTMSVARKDQIYVWAILESPFCSQWLMSQKYYCMISTAVN